jgi:hypothetical protein
MLYRWGARQLKIIKIIHLFSSSWNYFLCSEWNSEVKTETHKMAHWNIHSELNLKNHLEAQTFVHHPNCNQFTSGNRIVAKNVNKQVLIYSFEYKLRNNKTSFCRPVKIVFIMFSFLLFLWEMAFPN